MRKSVLGLLVVLKNLVQECCMNRFPTHVTHFGPRFHPCSASYHTKIARTNEKNSVHKGAILDGSGNPTGVGCVIVEIPPNHWTLMIKEFLQYEASGMKLFLQGHCYIVLVGFKLSG